jgi:hypothetical protein
MAKSLNILAGATRFELATSGVTGRRSKPAELRPLIFSNKTELKISPLSKGDYTLFYPIPPHLSTPLKCKKARCIAGLRMVGHAPSQARLPRLSAPINPKRSGP